MKRFETVPTTKFIGFYILFVSVPPVAFFLAQRGVHWRYVIPPLILVTTILIRQFYVLSRRHAEDALTRLEKALQTTQVGVTITDIEGKILYLNSAEARMHGYEPEELVGKNVRIFASPEIWEVNPPDMIREMSSWRRESENLRKEGKSFPVHLISDVIRNTSGDPIGIVTVCEDVTERRIAETKLRDSELKFRSVAESATDAIVLADGDGSIIFWNSGAQRIFGYSAPEAVGQALTLLMPRRYQDAHRAAIEKLSTGTSSRSTDRILEFHGKKKTGEEFPLELSLGMWTTAKGTFYSGIIRDITDRKMVEQELRLHEEQLEELVRKRTAELAETNRMLHIEIVERRQIEEELRKSEERYELAVKGGKEGLWDWNLKTDEIFYSIPWKTMLGYQDTEVTDQPEEWLNRVHPDDLQKLNVALTNHLDGKTEHFESEHRILQKDGTYRWVLTRGAAIRDEQGNAVRVAGIQRDIQARKLLEADWKQRAFCDALTALPNRALFMERLDQALHRIQRQRELMVAVLYVDLDYFKNINDTYGHRVGDQLLIAVSRKLKGCVRPSDTLARIGGDEFTILLEDLKVADEAIRVAERVCSELREPFYIDNFYIQTSGSIGVAVSSEDYEKGEALLNDADLAMYLAKDQGRSRHEVFQIRKTS
ncbi:PAS domain S-box protein [bacterium]|nr:PAS domain S-box protein [bacterium]MCI0601490.1 PAS domain S-box protein [bacterium]